jgi:hypothetical protein
LSSSNNDDDRRCLLFLLHSIAETAIAVTVSTSCVALACSFSFTVYRIFSSLAVSPVMCPTIHFHGSRFPPTSSSCSHCPPCSPACLHPHRSPSCPTSCSHQSDHSTPFHHRREDVPSSLIQSRRTQCRCRPHHPARARRGSGVHSAGNGRRLHLRLHRRLNLLIVESLPMSLRGE